MGALPRPDLPAGPQRELVDALHDLHHTAGWPSLRVLAREAGCSHTTVSTVFSSARVPSWGVLELVVEAMDGDASEFRALWLAATAPDDGKGAPPVRIAGRREELAAVRKHLQGGAGGLLLVMGEAGIGKTRLVSAASATLAGSGRFVVSGSCLPLSTEVPLLPVADALRSVFEVDDGQWLKEAVDGCAPYVAGSLRRLLPELDVPGAPPAPDDDWSRQRLFGAVAATLSALASLRPLAVLVEDLHWSDSATLDLLEHLVSRGVRVPLLGTWRAEDPGTPTGTVEWCARLRRMPTVDTLSLGPLSREETADQLDLLASHEVGPDVVDRIHRRSAGQPLFTEQLAAQLDDDRPLPELLGDLLDRRLEGLGGPARAIGQALGVADRPLADLLLSDITGLSPADLSAGLHELADRHLLRPATAHDVELRHPLLAEAIRRHLVAGEVVDVHRRIAIALARSSDPAAAEVAEHWLRAEEPGQELTWRINAATAAGERFALAQAAQQWRRALALWPEGVGSAGSPRIRKCEAYLAAMDALEYNDVAVGWEVAQEAMDALTDADSTDAAETYRRAAWFRGSLGDQSGALGLAEKAVRILESAPPSVGYADALGGLEYWQGALGRDDEAATTAALAVEVSAGLGEASRHRIRLSVLALYDAGAGALDLALARIDAARGVELPEPHPNSDVYLAVNHTDILLGAGAGPDEVVAAARPGLEAAAAWGLDTWPLSVLRANVSTAMRLAGQVGRAGEIIDPQTEESPTHLRFPDHSERAALDVCRGRLGAASERFEALSAFPVDSLANLVESTEGTAAADLWCGRPQAGLDRAMALLRNALATDASAYSGELLVLAARAAADLVDSQPSATHDRRALLDVLEGLHAHATRDPFEPKPSFAANPALATAWAAEMARLAGEPSVDRWVLAAREWDKLRRPHDAAYCRWRAAQVALATGQGTIALRLLRRAERDAREHVPLLSSIAEAKSMSA